LRGYRFSSMLYSRQHSFQGGVHHSLKKPNTDKLYRKEPLLMKRLIPLLIAILVFISPLQSAFNFSLSVRASAIPTISIVSVIRDETVTIRTQNYPSGVTFTARMGAMGTRGIGGTVVGTTPSAEGGSFLTTYEIPDSLHGSYRIAIRLDSPEGYYSFNWFYNNTTEDVADAPPPAPAPGYSGYPTFMIAAVVRDETVTIRTSNFPPEQTFTARIGSIGTRGVGGTVVGTTATDEGGSFLVTYSIPAAYRGASRLSIRMDSPQGYFAYNWFYNNTTAPVDGAPPPAAAADSPAPAAALPPQLPSVPVPAPVQPPAAQPAPTEAAQAPEAPAPTADPAGEPAEPAPTEPAPTEPAPTEPPPAPAPTQEPAPTLIPTLPPSPTAEPTATEAPTAAPPPTAEPAPSEVIPTLPAPPAEAAQPSPTVAVPGFAIVSVVHDRSVTVRAYNFPPDRLFTVRMGEMGTRGEGGIVVGFTNSGSGGSFYAVYEIPEELRGSPQIAVRMESPDGYFAYNWFHNSRLPQ
jgi:hypothetical protein